MDHSEGGEGHCSQRMHVLEVELNPSTMNEHQFALRDELTFIHHIIDLIM